jgi:hypothetical protein
MATLKDLANVAAKLGNELMTTDLAPCTEQKNGNQSCVTAEETRPLDREEKKKGWARRPFNAYDHRRMCNGCAAYWFATMASNVLHDMVCLNARVEAEKKARAAAAAT